mmetsp:Transcript_6459/g.11893  ORF Transcript_6459/g.11893 Transcript_6459/m.11893 type:complete len:94 (-) Transcript_6459:573-854(-)
MRARRSASSTARSSLFGIAQKPDGFTAERLFELRLLEDELRVDSRRLSELEDDSRRLDLLPLEEEESRFVRTRTYESRSVFLSSPVSYRVAKT